MLRDYAIVAVLGGLVLFILIAAAQPILYLAFGPMHSILN